MRVSWAPYLLLFSLIALPLAAQQPDQGSIPIGPEPTTIRLVTPDTRASTGLPDAPSSSARTNSELTNGQKFHVFLDNASSPLTLAAAGVAAPQGLRAPYNWSWSRAYTMALARRESNEFFGRFLFPALLNQDPRYHPADSENLVGRAFYAASRVAFTRTDQGHQTLNTSYLLSTVLTSTLANAYRPQWARSASNTMGDVGSTIGGDAGFNLFREFWPQLSRKLGSHTPTRFKKLGQKLSGDGEPKLEE